MPLYDFHCPACAESFELLIASSDKPTCPKCASPAINRLISPVFQPAASKAKLTAARTRARREGHFSNF